MSEETKPSTPETPNSLNLPEETAPVEGQPQVDLDDAAPIEDATDVPETVENGSDQLEVEGDEALPVVDQNEEPAEEEKGHEFPLSPAALREDIDKLDASFAEFAKAYNATVNNMNGLQMQVMQGFAQFQGWVNNAEGTLNNHNIRVNVLETLLIHPEFVSQLTAAIAPAVKAAMELEGDDLPERTTIQDLHKIAKEHVMPALKKQYEEAVKKAEEAKAAAEAEQKRQESGLVGPNGQSVSSQDSGKVVGLDGRPIQAPQEPQTVGLDDDDDDDE